MARMQRDAQLLGFPRLGDVAVDPAQVHGLHQGVDVGVAGQDDADGVRADVHRPLEELGAAHLRHALIRHDHGDVVRREHARGRALPLSAVRTSKSSP